MTLTRRNFIAVSGVGITAAACRGASTATRDPVPTPASSSATRSTVVDFYGAHQAGIGTPAQDRLAFAAFDVVTTSTRLAELLRTWTAAAAAMTAGHMVPGASTNPHRAPADTGEAMGLSPSRLTVTIGYGPSLFDRRFGLQHRRPAALIDLPPFKGDALDPKRSGGDIAIQACADDPQVAFHAVRNLARLGRGRVRLRWTQLGFGRTSVTNAAQSTPRNLMGFRDGTRNITGDDAAAMAEHVWVGPEGDQHWMRDGSYVVARRIQMHIEDWDHDALGVQEKTIGRRKVSGAPLGGHAEFDPPDFGARGKHDYVIPHNAHIRLASADHNKGVRILRRGYSFTDGVDARTGEVDAGLFFLAYQKDPRRQFVALQHQLAAADALNEYIRHTASGIWACPPGVAAGGSWGDVLFG